MFAGRYEAFTCVSFQGDGYTLGKPTEYGVWLSNYPVRDKTNILQVYYGNSYFRYHIYTSILSSRLFQKGFRSKMGALFTFSPAPTGKTTTILVRVGVSLISSAQACAHAEEEIPDFDFDSVHTANLAQWNELLGRAQVDTTGIPLDTVQLFYSSVSLCAFLFFSFLVLPFGLLTVFYFGW